MPLPFIFDVGVKYTVAFKYDGSSDVIPFVVSVFILPLFITKYDLVLYKYELFPPIFMYSGYDNNPTFSNVLVWHVKFSPDSLQSNLFVLNRYVLFIDDLNDVIELLTFAFVVSDSIVLLK